MALRKWYVMRSIMNETEFNKYVEGISPAYSSVIKNAAEYQDSLAKPPRSLGKLEDISVRISGITGRLHNEIRNCRVLVFAADNGVYDEGIAITPQYVTLQQAMNMTRHKTGMSCLAEYFGNSIRVIDVGINSDIEFPGIINRKVRKCTGNIRREPAMTRAEALAAISTGIWQAEEAADEGVEAVGIGEMGIANTTTSAAVLAVLTGAEAASVTGRGSGLTDEAFALKQRVIAEAIELNHPDPADPIDVLSNVGGLDIAAMTGAYIGCARRRIPAVVDGFISIVAALTAVRLCPDVSDFLFLSHFSAEKGYKLAAEEIGDSPFLMLDMRLGEGSGCPLAFQIMGAACAAMNRMATFEEAAINDGYLEGIRVKR